MASQNRSKDGFSRHNDYYIQQLMTEALLVVMHFMKFFCATHSDSLCSFPASYGLDLCTVGTFPSIITNKSKKQHYVVADTFRFELRLLLTTMNSLLTPVQLLTVGRTMEEKDCSGVFTLSAQHSCFSLVSAFSLCVIKRILFSQFNVSLVWLINYTLSSQRWVLFRFWLVQQNRQCNPINS